MEQTGSCGQVIEGKNRSIEAFQADEVSVGAQPWVNFSLLYIGPQLF